MINFNTPDFIKKYITKRDHSLFREDIEKYQESLYKEINHKDVLVIGGAGTIGSNYIKSLLPYKPGSLTVVDYSENGLTELTRDLRSTNNLFIPATYKAYSFDFGSSIFTKLIRNNNYDIIACFAAHKHVRSEKDHLSIEAMIRNNVFNTEKILRHASSLEPDHFFSVSTDKAANPVNVMGASKKLMEKILMTYSRKMSISTARFANVAFSNGSLLFGFVQRMMKRQPLTAPFDVKRYFVSPEESGELCLLANIIGESGDIFFPKLGEEQMMKFSTIAEDFLDELEMECDYCDSEDEAKRKADEWSPGDAKYPVYFFETDTSGEKMFEEFYESSDDIDLESFDQLGIIKNAPRSEVETMQSIMKEFDELFKDEISKSDIIAVLNKYLQGFNHIETGKNLDDKM
jgi:FlaA1/EpsC-like NDP-sugar epimerase